MRHIGAPCDRSLSYAPRPRCYRLRPELAGAALDRIRIARLQSQTRPRADNHPCLAGAAEIGSPSAGNIPRVPGTSWRGLDRKLEDHAPAAVSADPRTSTLASYIAPFQSLARGQKNPPICACYDESRQ